MRNEVDNKCQGFDSEDTKSDHHGDKSSANSFLGLVQSKATHGMESGVPIDPGECSKGVASTNRARMGYDERPLVGVSGTLCNVDAEKRLYDGAGEEDRMDFDGGSIVPPSI